MMKNRIVVREKVQIRIEHLYFFLALIYILSKIYVDIIGTVTRTNSKNMTGLEVSIQQVFPSAVLSANMSFVTFIRNEVRK